MNWHSMDEKPRVGIPIVLLFTQNHGFVYTAQLREDGSLWIADETTAIESWDDADQSMRWGYLECMRSEAIKESKL